MEAATSRLKVERNRGFLEASVSLSVSKPDAYISAAGRSPPRGRAAPHSLRSRVLASGRRARARCLPARAGASAAGRRCPHVRRLRTHLRLPRPAPPIAPPRRDSLAAARRGGAGAAPGLISDAVSRLCSVVPDPERSWGCGAARQGRRAAPQEAMGTRAASRCPSANPAPLL